MKRIIFFIVIMIAFALRFYSLGKTPSSLDWDEVSNSYNAYSILKTARDEYGTFLPISNRSFDDYKPPLYMYLEIPAVAFLGLNDYSARIPSATFGTFTVIMVYFLAKKLFKDELISQLSMYLFAISPWTVHFSRIGFEANLGLFFTIAAITTILYSIPDWNKEFKKRNIFLTLSSSILFALSLYTYHSTRIVTPFLVLVILILYKKQILKIPKKVAFLSIAISLIIISPLFIFFSKSGISSRLESTSMSATAQDLQVSVNLINMDKKLGQKFSNIIYNRRLIIAQATFARYLSHFDINYLFTSGDNNLRHHIKNHGLLYLFQLPLVLYGIYTVFKKQNIESYLLIAWLIISPIPASFGDAYPHAVRSLNMSLPLILLSAIGMSAILKLFKQRKVIFVVLSFVVVLSTLDYLHNYYFHYPSESAGSWQFGYKKAVETTMQLQNNYKEIIIDPSIEQAHAYWLFYSKYDPKTYQNYGDNGHFDKYYFNYSQQRINGQLFVSSASNFSSSYNLLNTIYYPDGTEAIKIGEIK